MRRLKKFLPLIIAVAVLATTIPAVAAYEAHMMNVTAHVEQKFGTGPSKFIRLATPEEIAEAEASGVIFPSTPNPPTVTDPFNIPMYTCVVWVVTIVFQPPEDGCVTDVTVKDNFGAELGVNDEPLGPGRVDLTIIEHSRGKAKIETFQTQYRIMWYVTWNDTVSPPDNMDVICPGDGPAMLTLLVWTKLNPAGHQEYTSPGLYQFNSGPTAKWIDNYGNQQSIEGESLYIDVY